MNRSRSLSALCAFFVVASLLAACGSSEGVPGNAVVRVGDLTIKKTTFEHWLRVAATSQAGASDPAAAANGKTPKVTIPVPPDFKACVKVKAAVKPVKGQPQPTEAQLKLQCKTEYETLRNQVLQFLISSEWISGEAVDQKVKVTDKEVQKQFDTTKQQSFPKDEDFQKFLKSAGMTENDLRFRVKLDSLSNKLKAKVIKGKDKVTAAQIATYYNKNKARFAQPERRDLRIVLTKTKGKAERALSQLRAGVRFSKVAKALSIDQASKGQGGVLLAVAKGQQEKALDDAVFAAKTGKLVGPVKTNFGYYVFKVQKVTKATQQSLKEATPVIKQQLGTENQDKALKAFVSRFRKKWKARTDCRTGFQTKDCKNPPPKKKKPTTSTAAVPPATAPPTAAPTTSGTPPPATTTP